MESEKIKIWNDAKILLEKASSNISAAYLLLEKEEKDLDVETYLDRAFVNVSLVERYVRHTLIQGGNGDGHGGV